MRTIVEIPGELVESLDKIRAKEKRSRASLIRDAISAYVEKKKKPDRKSVV